MKKEKILIILMPIMLFCLAIFGYIKVINTKTDQIKFKEEYEALNNEYYEVKIPTQNSIKYSSYDEIFNVLDKNSGIIYLGYKEDDNSRYAIETLINVINDNSIKANIYYLNIYNDRDLYTIEDGKLVYEKDKNGNEIKGTKNYFKLVSYLDNFLGEYLIYFDDIEYNTNKKRIPLPSIIFVKDGDILSLEYVSVDMDHEDVYSNFEEYVLKIYSDTCELNHTEPC